MEENPYQSPQNVQRPRRRVWLWLLLAGVAALGIFLMMVVFARLLWVSPGAPAPMAVPAKAYPTSP